MRYKVVSGSQSMHCCFDATVVDTKTPLLHIDGSFCYDESGQLYKNVCECLELEDAQFIAAALNKIEEIENAA